MSGPLRATVESQPRGIPVPGLTLPPPVVPADPVNPDSPSAQIGVLSQFGSTITGNLGDSQVLLHEQGAFTTGTVGAEPVTLQRQGDVIRGRVGNQPVLLNDLGHVTTDRIGDQIVIIRGP